jgi:hypothetical protein
LQPAPALSPGGLLLAVIILFALGGVAVLRRQRRA